MYIQYIKTIIILITCLSVGIFEARSNKSLSQLSIIDVKVNLNYSSTDI